MLQIVIAAAMEVLGFQSKSGAPTKFPIPEDLEDQTTSEKRKYLHKAASKIVEKIIFSEEDTNNLISGILNMQDKENAIKNQQLTNDQGWVDYKMFVVRYNYSYFKNM